MFYKKEFINEAELPLRDRTNTNDTHILIFGSLLLQHNLPEPDSSWLDRSQIKPEMIGLISIAWLLLIIDRTLSLGFLDSVVNIAKGVKDLTK